MSEEKTSEKEETTSLHNAKEISQEDARKFTLPETEINSIKESIDEIANKEGGLKGMIMIAAGDKSACVNVCGLDEAIEAAITSSLLKHEQLGELMKKCFMMAAMARMGMDMPVMDNASAGNAEEGKEEETPEYPVEEGMKKHNSNLPKV